MPVVFELPEVAHFALNLSPMPGFFRAPLLLLEPMLLFKVIWVVALFLCPKRLIPEDPEDAVEAGTVCVSRVTRLLLALFSFSLDSSDGSCLVG